MRDMMNYKEHWRSEHYCDEDYSKVEFIRSLVNYEGTDVMSLRRAVIYAQEHGVNLNTLVMKALEEQLKI